MNPVIPTALGQSLVGAQQGERAQAMQRPQAKKPVPLRGREEDEVAVHLEPLDATRSLKNNTDEEARQDHETHDPQHQVPPAKRIDVQG